MRLYKSSEYAIRCLVAMAHGGDGLYSARHLAETLDIPYKFLGRLMSRLAEAGIVESVQGKAGGYRIARPLADIRLADIVDVVEGLASYDRCILGFERCDEQNPCPLHDMWKGQKQGILDMMHDVTLAQMAA
ncbi:MAG TPA: Rrf2 family transcriptional regulator, partial [Candidatus Krumholzibacteria bacterium]|nr:Rrf2 family transcriptional regulator [Candidatus Krumholzibacteria bacterium]